MFVPLNTPINSLSVVIITVLYFLTSSITTFDIRMIQAKRDGVVPPDEPALPKWVSIIYWVDWALAICLLLLNWKYAIFLFVIRIILKILPVLETSGNMLMSPFKSKIK